MSKQEPFVIGLFIFTVVMVFLLMISAVNQDDRITALEMQVLESYWE